MESPMKGLRSILEQGTTSNFSTGLNGFSLTSILPERGYGYCSEPRLRQDNSSIGRSSTLLQSSKDFHRAVTSRPPPRVYAPRGEARRSIHSTAGPKRPGPITVFNLSKVSTSIKLVPPTRIFRRSAGSLRVSTRARPSTCVVEGNVGDEGAGVADEGAPSEDASAARIILRGTSSAVFPMLVLGSAPSATPCTGIEDFLGPPAPLRASKAFFRT